MNYPKDILEIFFQVLSEKKIEKDFNEQPDYILLVTLYSFLAPLEYFIKEVDEMGCEKSVNMNKKEWLEFSTTYYKVYNSTINACQSIMRNNPITEIERKQYQSYLLWISNVLKNLFAETEKFMYGNAIFAAKYYALLFFCIKQIEVYEHKIMNEVPEYLKAERQKNAILKELKDIEEFDKKCNELEDKGLLTSEDKMKLSFFWDRMQRFVGGRMPEIVNSLIQ